MINNPYTPGDPACYDLSWVVERLNEHKFAEESAAEAKASAEAAEASAQEASGYADDAEGYRDAASGFADDASGYADAASDSADEAADYAAHIGDPVSGLVTSWLEDNITQPTTPAIDASLTVGGAAADAKATGDRIQPLESDIGCSSTDQEYADWSSNQLLCEDEIFHFFGGAWKSTDYLYCNGSTTLYYRATVFVGTGAATRIAYVSFYDANKNLISYLKSSDYPADTHITVTGDTPIPSNAYYVRVCGDALDGYAKFEGSGITRELEILNAANTHPFNSIFIGDSLTRGVINSSVQIIEESYPYWVGKILTSEVHNCGYPGGQPQTWWARRNLYDQPDPTTDIALIMFGTNGSLDVNTLATDVEPYTDYNDYANTGCGCMCKIIEWIMEETENHAQIFLLTPPMNWATTGTPDYAQYKFNVALNTVPVVRAIAQRYGLPVIDVFYECGMNKYNGDEFRPDDGVHFSATGYHKLGSFIAHKIKSMYSTFTIGETGTIIP